MFLMRFTERAYVAYSAEDVQNSFRSAVRLTFPNRHFNPALGANLYNEYLDEYEYSDRIGFDGLMLNEPGPHDQERQDCLAWQPTADF